MSIRLSAEEIKLILSLQNDASAQLKTAIGDINALEESVEGAGDTTDDTSEDFDGMGVALKSLKGYLALVVAAVGAMVVVFKFSEEGAELERLKDAGHEMARQLGGDMDLIVEKVKAASLGTVSEMDIIGSANKAMMLGLGADANELANLMEVAAFRGRAMGISTTQAFDDIVRGIGRASPLILDNLGIIIDADATYEDYAESIGKSKDELTKAEKTQALLNKTLETGNEMLEKAGGLADDSAAQFERLGATWLDFINGIKEGTGDTGGDFAEFLAMSLEGWRIFGEVVDKQITLNEKAIYLRDTLDPMNAGWQEYLPLAQEMLEKQRALDAEFQMSAGAVTAAADAVGDLIEVDKEAVKGAMAVFESYQKNEEKLAGLQTEHDKLTAKKQDLLNRGYWPENSAIINLNEKLAENEQKQNDVTLAIQGTLEAMLLQTAAAGLDAEGQLALARAMGTIDEATYQALTAQNLLKASYEKGIIDAPEYARKTLELRDAIARLESKKITITADAIFNEIRNVIRNTTNAINVRPGSGRALGTKGWEEVPSGYPDDTYPLLLTSGERFAVTPAGVNASPASVGGFGGGGNSFHVTYSPGISFGDESEAVNRLYPLFLEMIQKAKANGHL
jgi:hypothetical protein